MLPPLAPGDDGETSQSHTAARGDDASDLASQQQQGRQSHGHPRDEPHSTTTYHSDGAAATPRLPNLGIEAQEEELAWRYFGGDFTQSADQQDQGAHKGRRRRSTTKPRVSRPTTRRRRRQRHGERPSDRRHDDPQRVHRAARGVRERVLHFTPSWFSVVMGTGVISTLLLLLPWKPLQPGLRYPAAVWLVLDMALFLLFSAAFLARYAIYPQVLPLTIKHPQKSMFLGTVPMGLIVIISNICQLGTVQFRLGVGPTLAAAGLWWFATALSLVTAIGVPFVVTTYQSHSFSSTTAALLLPIVPPITAAATGSTIATALVDAGYTTYAFTILVVSYMVLGIGLPLALLILVLYFQRLLLFKQPPREVIISVFLPLGPCGQGGEALLHLGQVAYKLFPVISTEPGTGVPNLTLPVGQALFGAGLLGALLLWAFGIWWLFLAVATLVREVRRRRIGFNMGFWGATFPMGSMAICTARLAEALDSLALRIVYTILFLATLTVWFCVAIPTFKGFIDGSLLSRAAAPCIADLPLDPLKKEPDSDGEDDDDGNGNNDGDDDVEDGAAERRLSRDSRAPTSRPLADRDAGRGSSSTSTKHPEGAPRARDVPMSEKGAQNLM
ncbi:unnamed protein product [Parajaminaea phylloscopi]